jgi:hypothetical protein
MSEHEAVFRERVAGLRIRGHQGYGRCPFHDDARASFSVDLDTGLWTCHAGCGTGNANQFAERLGLRNTSKAPANVDRIVATYPYIDERGELLFEVVRFEPKGFCVRRPDGPTGWIWNLEGVRRVPYRLRELLTAVHRGERVHIVEGEKDSDRLASAGLAVTTNPGGAGKWRTEFAPYFKGSKVAILPDNDDPGRRHAEQVARSLYGVAAEVKVVALPGLPPKGDVSDWLAAGHTVDELHRLVDDARPWRPASQIGLPEEGYVGIAADFADLYSTHTESPRSFLYINFLAYLGALISPRVTLESELRPQPRLYVVNLGGSGDTRKSSSLDHTDRFFHDAIKDFGQYVHYGLGSGEALARRLGRDDRGNVKSLLTHLDELRLLTDKARADSSILLPMLATLFERNVFDNSSLTHTISVRDGHLSLIAASTVETYAAIWTPAFLNIGFTNRLWLVVGEPESRHALPVPVPVDLRQTLIRNLGDLLARIDHAAGTGHLVQRLDDDARELWEGWYAAMPRTIHSRRLDTYGMRLMILLSLSRGDLDLVSADTVRRVCALLNHQLALRQEFDPIDAETTMARMEEQIRRVLRAKGPLTNRDLRRFTNAGRVGLWIFEQAKANLLSAKDIKFDASKRWVLMQEVSADA